VYNGHSPFLVLGNADGARACPEIFGVTHANATTSNTSAGTIRRAVRDISTPSLRARNDRAMRGSNDPSD
jgi:hypothetical protein